MHGIMHGQHHRFSRTVGFFLVKNRWGSGKVCEKNLWVGWVSCWEGWACCWEDFIHICAHVPYEDEQFIYKQWRDQSGLKNSNWKEQLASLEMSHPVYHVQAWLLTLS